MSKLVHFELPAADAKRAKGFWSGLLGWKYQTFEGPVEYHMLDTQKTPGGAIYPGEDAGSGPIVYFGVDDIDASLAKVRELAGEVLQEKQPIPGVGWFARCRDTEGNRFSLFESDESVAPGY